MSWKKMLVSGFAALAAVVVGFFLPDLAGAVQRRALSQGSERVNVENIELHFAQMTFAEKLETAVTGDTEIVMDTGAHLSQKDAVGCAQDMLLFFQETGFSDVDPYDSGLGFSAQAFYTVSYASLESFVQWRIVIRDEAQGLEMYLLLDDESGLPLAFSRLPQSPAHMELSPGEIAIAWGMLYAEFTGLEFVGAYPPDTKTLIEAASDTFENTDPYTDVSEWEQWILELRQQDDRTVRLSFFCLDGYYYFNVF